MRSEPDPEMTDDENPEWTEEDFARAKPFSALPEEHQRILKGIMEQRGKKTVAIELSQDVVQKMQATGDGWELRIEEAVRQWLFRQGKRRKVS